MSKNDVWNLTARPTEAHVGKKPNIIDSEWVFEKKLESNGSIKYETRLVTRGFRDTNHYDLRGTYAPVSRLSLVRAVMEIMSKYNLQAG